MQLWTLLNQCVVVSCWSWQRVAHVVSVLCSTLDQVALTCSGTNVWKWVSPGALTSSRPLTVCNVYDSSVHYAFLWKHTDQPLHYDHQHIPNLHLALLHEPCICEYSVFAFHLALNISTSKSKTCHPLPLSVVIMIWLIVVCRYLR